MKQHVKQCSCLGCWAVREAVQHARKGLSGMVQVNAGGRHICVHAAGMEQCEGGQAHPGIQGRHTRSQPLTQCTHRDHTLTMCSHVPAAAGERISNPCKTTATQRGRPLTLSPVLRARADLNPPHAAGARRSKSCNTTATQRGRPLTLSPVPRLQIKILREDEESGKVGPDGKPRSKGLGFIEFT